MKVIDQIYINGSFVKPHGNQFMDLINPLNQEIFGKVALADEKDTQLAIQAAKTAFKSFSKTTVAERVSYLEKMHQAVSKRKQDLIDVMVYEFGGPVQFSTAVIQNGLDAIQASITALKDFKFVSTVGTSQVRMESLGVVGIITPWNASNMFIVSKLSSAIAAGCTVVIKPSEMSAMQTQIIAESLHEAGLPAGVFNILNGLGTVVGQELSTNKDVSKISFTGSTVVGKAIAVHAVETMKRVTLELGGKSAAILLDDVNFNEAIPLALFGGLMSGGQVCTAGTRILIPENRLEEVKQIIKETIPTMKVGNPSDQDTAIGPLVSKKQYLRVQEYIQLGIDEGAELVVGGLGQPEGMESGNFVKPTVFAGVTNDMRIAQEEIFGPVLVLITYKIEEEAIAIANDSIYGLAGYVFAKDVEKGREIAAQIDAGHISVNGLKHDPLAPFGGFKQSGIGREFGAFGMSAYLEPKTILV
ncbi:aldehyde dehydrogenase family protein [Flavobacterium sp. JP2137]|uniref:aldehyde dehydrogenase family protein n=1 Tax=Flavobacterium sp. JP2137 TaxID=3414510 RepID=UPI003D2FE107